MHDPILNWEFNINDKGICNKDTILMLKLKLLTILITSAFVFHGKN
jgi:hypothetical protein